MPGVNDCLQNQRKRILCTVLSLLMDRFNEIKNCCFRFLNVPVAQTVPCTMTKQFASNAPDLVTRRCALKDKSKVRGDF